MCTPRGPQLGYQQKVSPTPSPQAEALMAVLLKAATSRLLIKGTSHHMMLGDKAAQGKGCPVSEHAMCQAACSSPADTHHQAPGHGHRDRRLPGCVPGIADWQARMQHWAGKC